MKAVIGEALNTDFAINGFHEQQLDTQRGAATENQGYSDRAGTIGQVLRSSSKMGGDWGRCPDRAET